MARISELHYSNAYAASSGVSEFLEVALAPGEDPADFTVSFYQATGLVGIEITLDHPDVQVSVDPDTGEFIYVISADDFPIFLTDPDGGGANNYEAYALTDTSGPTPQVIDFYDIGGGTQNILAIDGLAAGETSDNLAVLVGPNATTTTLQFNQPDPDTLAYETISQGDSGVACFVAGTLIDTPDGPRPIETLGPGERIVTRDAGAQTVCWAGATEVAGQGALAPIRIRAGVLGATRDIEVSPNHRILVTGWQAELFFGADEVLVPAKALVNGTTVAPAPRARVRYVHVMCGAHQVVRSSGLWSESFYPGRHGIAGLGTATGRELLTLFPQLGTGPAAYGPTARPVRALREAQLLRVA